MIGPSAKDRVRRRETDTMRTLLVDMHFDGNAGFSQCEIKKNTVFHGNHLIFGGVKQEGGRGLAGNLEFV